MPTPHMNYGVEKCLLYLMPCKKVLSSELRGQGGGTGVPGSKMSTKQFCSSELMIQSAIPVLVMPA
jgi:hypothetical protein